MVLADLGRKITTALHSLSKATIINEEVGDLKANVLIPHDMSKSHFTFIISSFFPGPQCNAQRDMHSITGS